MYELCLDPETARQLAAANRPKKEAGEQADTLPEPAPETTAAAEEKPIEWSKDPRYAVAFAMILHWSKYGGC